MQGGHLSVGDGVTASIDKERRSQIMPNHTMTHVLNFALKAVCGDHIDQKGSIVLPDKLRFDFSNPGPVEAAALGKIEAIVRQQVRWWWAQPLACAASVCFRGPMHRAQIALYSPTAVRGRWGQTCHLCRGPLLTHLLHLRIHTHKHALTRINLHALTRTS